MNAPGEEKVYILSKKVMCKKHPSKSIEYFCTNPQCTERIFCSACLLKKEFCRHDIATEIKDIGEFLYEQKVLFEMKGLSSSPQIFDFLQNRDKREEQYKQSIMEQYFKFEQQCEVLIQQVHQVVSELKANIREQIEGYDRSYLKCSEKLINSISQNFSDSVLSKFQTFPEVLNTFDVSESKGLTRLIETLYDCAPPFSAPASHVSSPKITVPCFCPSCSLCATSFPPKKSCSVAETWAHSPLPPDSAVCTGLCSLDRLLSL